MASRLEHPVYSLRFRVDPPSLRSWNAIRAATGLGLDVSLKGASHGSLSSVRGWLPHPLSRVPLWLLRVPVPRGALVTRWSVVGVVLAVLVGAAHGFCGVVRALCMDERESA